MKKLYTVESRTTIYEYLSYSVEAETEEEAIQLVQDGEVEDNDDHEQKDGGEVDYYVTEVEDLEE